MIQFLVNDEIIIVIALNIIVLIAMILPKPNCGEPCDSWIQDGILDCLAILSGGSNHAYKP